MCNVFITITTKTILLAVQNAKNVSVPHVEHIHLFSFRNFIGSMQLLRQESPRVKDKFRENLSYDLLRLTGCSHLDIKFSATFSHRPNYSVRSQSVLSHCEVIL